MAMVSLHSDKTLTKLLPIASPPIVYLFVKGPQKGG